MIIGEIGSGAVHTVGPPTIANAFPLQETIASRNGENYVAANGTDIENYGQRIINGLDQMGNNITMPMQVANVDKLLVAAKELTKAGWRVNLETGEGGRSLSHVDHKKTGRKVPLNNDFQFTIKVPKARKPGVSTITTHNRYAALEEDDIESDFRWQGCRL